MWHRIAGLLGGRTIAEWQQAMTHAEFVDWCAYYGIEPWGGDAENWRAGVISATVANYAGRSRKRADAKPSDFMPKSNRRKRRQSAAEIERALREASKQGETSNGDGTG